MSKRRLATIALGGCFCALATAALLTLDAWVFVGAIAFQAAMFAPEWGGRK